MGVAYNGGRRLVGVALSLMAGKERIPEIGMGEKIALDQSAAAQRCAVGESHAPKPEAVFHIAGQRAFAEIFFGAGDITHALVGDEFVKSGLIEQGQHEGRVRERELADDQPGGGENLAQETKIVFGLVAGGSY